MELIFVYNAKKGVANSLLDGIHKVVSPSTYACDLCAITYHALGKREAWRTFLEDLTLPVRFYYKNTIPNEFKQDFEFPAVLRYENSAVSCILDKHDFETINDLQEFIVLLEQKVPELGRNELL